MTPETTDPAGAGSEVAIYSRQPLRLCLGYEHKRANNSTCTNLVQYPPPRFPVHPTAQLPTAVGLEAFYRGIGSETERLPVVIAGSDPDKAMVGSRLHTGTPAGTPNAVACGMLSAASPPGTSVINYGALNA